MTAVVVSWLNAWYYRSSRVKHILLDQLEAFRNNVFGADVAHKGAELLVGSSLSRELVA